MLLAAVLEKDLRRADQIRGRRIDNDDIQLGNVTPVAPFERIFRPILDRHSRRPRRERLASRPGERLGLTVGGPDLYANRAFAVVPPKLQFGSIRDADFAAIGGIDVPDAGIFGYFRGAQGAEATALTGG